MSSFEIQNQEMDKYGPIMAFRVQRSPILKPKMPYSNIHTTPVVSQILPLVSRRQLIKSCSGPRNLWISNLEVDYHSPFVTDYTTEELISEDSGNSTDGHGDVCNNGETGILSKRVPRNKAWGSTFTQRRSDNTSKGITFNIEGYGHRGVLNGRARYVMANHRENKQQKPKELFYAPGPQSNSNDQSAHSVAVTSAPGRKSVTFELHDGEGVGDYPNVHDFDDGMAMMDSTDQLLVSTSQVIPYGNTFPTSSIIDPIFSQHMSLRFMQSRKRRRGRRLIKPEVMAVIKDYDNNAHNGNHDEHSNLEKERNIQINMGNLVHQHKKESKKSVENNASTNGTQPLMSRSQTPMAVSTAGSPFRRNEHGMVFESYNGTTVVERTAEPVQRQRKDGTTGIQMKPGSALLDTIHPRITNRSGTLGIISRTGTPTSLNAASVQGLCRNGPSGTPRGMNRTAVHSVCSKKGISSYERETPDIVRNFAHKAEAQILVGDARNATLLRGGNRFRTAVLTIISQNKEKSKRIIKTSRTTPSASARYIRPSPPTDSRGHTSMEDSPFSGKIKHGPWSHVQHHHKGEHDSARYTSDLQKTNKGKPIVKNKKGGHGNKRSTKSNISTVFNLNSDESSTEEEEEDKDEGILIAMTPPWSETWSKPGILVNIKQLMFEI